MLNGIFSHERAVKRIFQNHIRSRVTDKKVLDLGCVDHDAEARHREWMHGYIEAHADEVLGVDILEEEVRSLQREGYNVQYGDAQDLDLDDEFEVIVLGDLIEHLTNFDGLFHSIDAHLEKEGRVVITTPNVGSLVWNIRRTIGKEFNREHTCWFEEQVMGQLLNRFGFEIESVEFARALGFSLHPINFCGWAMERVLPARIGHQTMVVVAKRVDE